MATLWEVFVRISLWLFCINLSFTRYACWIRLSVVEWISAKFIDIHDPKWCNNCDHISLKTKHERDQSEYERDREELKRSYEVSCTSHMNGTRLTRSYQAEKERLENHNEQALKAAKSMYETNMLTMKKNHDKKYRALEELANHYLVNMNFIFLEPALTQRPASS